MKNARDKQSGTNKLPPDGGYGWVVAFAMALNSFIYIPLSSCFGLIFKDTFNNLGLSASQVALIVNLHTAFGMLTGVLNGVLLKMFGYRKLALLSAVLYFLGITCTAFSHSFQCFIIFYGLIASLGVGLCKSAYTLALNTYFKKRRNKAISITVTVTGFGPILFPQLITFLMKFYNAHGVMLIFGGICAHFFPTALLLQPVKWHMKEDAEELTRGDEIPQDVSKSENEEERTKSFLTKITDFFDLDLLQDKVFVNILLGMSLVMFVDINFTLLTPFILDDVGLSTDQTATFMSVLAASDILFRFLAPYIGDLLKNSPRDMYLLTLVAHVAIRFCLVLFDDFFILVGVAAALGISKGIRRVYMKLIIPAHVALDKLPSASGMELMVNGFCILTGGWILGMVRDFTGSYYHCIIIMNCVNLITIVMWIAEGAWVKFSNKPNLKHKQINT